MRKIPELDEEESMLWPKDGDEERRAKAELTILPCVIWCLTTKRYRKVAINEEAVELATKQFRRE